MQSASNKTTAWWRTRHRIPWPDTAERQDDCLLRDAESCDADPRHDK
jgi:hypothetical protein